VEPIVVHGFGLVNAASSGAMDVSVSASPLHKARAARRQPVLKCFILFSFAGRALARTSMNKPGRAIGSMFSG
jgi:hypothetical protein